MQPLRYAINATQDGKHSAVGLRAALASDSVTLAALSTQVFLDTYATDGVRPDLAREAFHACCEPAFAARLSEPDRRFVLAERGEALLGFAEVLCGSHFASPAGLGRGTGAARVLAFYRRMGYADVGATTYSFEGNTYGNRVLARHLPPVDAREHREKP